MVDRGLIRTGPTPVDQRLDQILGAFDHHLDPTVVEIVSPPGYAEPLGFSATGVAEEDTLHTAGDEEAASNHLCSVSHRVSPPNTQKWIREQPWQLGA